jgi:hypothetical protein
VRASVTVRLIFQGLNALLTIATAANLQDRIAPGGPSDRATSGTVVDTGKVSSTTAYDITAGGSTRFV